MVLERIDSGENRRPRRLGNSDRSRGSSDRIGQRSDRPSARGPRTVRAISSRIEAGRVGAIPRGRLHPRGTRRAAIGSGRPRWEHAAIEAIGRVIEFWGFKRNHGRVWALLYLQNASLTAAELESALQLSKGAISMLLRELEQWLVIKKVASSTDALWHYRAEFDVLKLATQVFARRELKFVESVHAELLAAMKAAVASRADRAILDRLRHLVLLARTAESALSLILQPTKPKLDAIASVVRAFRRYSKGVSWTNTTTK